MTSRPPDTTRHTGSPLLVFSLMVIISSSECFFLMLCAFSGQPDRLWSGGSQRDSVSFLFSRHDVTETSSINRDRCNERRENGGGATSPSVSGKHVIGMSEAVAARQGAVGQLLLIGLPGKGQPADGRLLLPLGSQWTAAGAAVGGVFS